MRYSREAEFKNVCSCFLSQRDFQYGPHIYDGRRVPQWDIMVCKHCHAGNWDGIVIESHPRLAAHLKSRGIEICLNEKGWLDWPR